MEISGRVKRRKYALRFFGVCPWAMLSFRASSKKQAAICHLLWQFSALGEDY